MAASLQVSQNKRGRDESLNGGLPSPDAKRTNVGTLGLDSDLMAFLEKIDGMDNNYSKLEDSHTAMNEVEGEVRLNGVIKSLENEIGLKAHTDNDIESTDDKGSTNVMGSKSEGELTADGNSEATSVGSVGSDIGDFRYYDDVRGELGFFVDHFTPHELGIITNPIDGDSNAHIMHSDAVHCYVETTEVFYGSLWEDDIWFLNGHSVIQNDFESQRQEEFGIGEDEFYDIWN